MTAKTTSAERRADFYAEADRRWAEYLKTGGSIPWEELRCYLLDRLHGKATSRPRARKISK